MLKLWKKTIYLDHASATPVDKSVTKFTSRIERELFANPSAIHKDGVRVRKAIDDARSRIATLMYAHSDEIIFTGSGTEGNAIAILGVVNTYKGTDLPHIITTEVEHPSVLENCRMLEMNKKAEVTYLKINEQGTINPKDLRDALKENTVLVSVMYANNEIGTIQPIREIAKEIRHHRKTIETNFPIFHTDACQAMNYLDIENIDKLGVDLLTFNSSKIYGPKGIAVLYKKRGVDLDPIYTGGGQESGLRSGTENVVGIVAIAKAFEIACAMKEKESVRLVKLRDYAMNKLLTLSKASGYEIILNGDKENRLPNNVNISISGISSELLVIELDARGILVSERSACSSDDESGSHVIQALRKAQNIESSGVDGSLRISLGRSTKNSDIDNLVKSLQAILVKYKNWK
jgi:cysteine desulfurase